MKYTSHLSYIKSLLLSLFAALSIGTSANAQSLIHLSDATGISISASEEAELQTAADSLVAALPVAFQDSFKVYDCGLYLQQEHYQGGYPEVFGKLVDEAGAQSKYYLVVGKSLQTEGSLKIWVGLKIPQTGNFDCLDNEKLYNIGQYIQAAGNEKSISGFKSELATLLIGKDYFYKIVECSCDGIRDESCSLSKDYKFINLELSALGFRKLNIEVGDSCTFTILTPGIYDFFGKQVKIEGGQDYCIAQEVSESKAIFDASEQVLPDTTISTSLSGRVYILDNESFINGEWEDAKAQSENFKYVEYWVVVKDEVKNKYYLYSKFTLGKLEIIKEAGPITFKGDDDQTRSGVIPTPFSIALNLLGNAAIDAIIQSIGFRIFDKEVKSQASELNKWIKAWGKVDKGAAAWEGISSLIPWENGGVLKGALLRAATSGLAVVIDHAISGNYPNYTVKDGLVDFAITFGTSSLTQLIAQKFKLDKSPNLISDGLDNWYDNVGNSALKKVVFYVARVYDDFTNSVVKSTKYIEQKVAISNVKKIDLMGGKKSQLGGDFVNIDLTDGIEKGIKGDATILGKFLPANSVDEVVVSNPRLGSTNKAGDYISQLGLIVKKGKFVYINGHVSNKFFNDINSSLASQHGFKIVSEKIPLLDRFKSIKFADSLGKPFTPDQISKMKSTILEKL